MNSRWFLLLFPALLWASCQKAFQGEELPNQAPETYMVADTIQRFEDNRFKSVVEVQWWGDDKDGFVKGYEISTDGLTWTLTTEQDSVFTLVLPGNSDTADFQFMVRAIDNEGLADPTPASLVYPVKNSDPEVHFIISARTPTRSFPALKYFWEGSDPDGNSSLDHYELCWNDTTLTPFQVSASFADASFVVSDLNAASPYCLVYPGNSNSPLSDSMPGMVLNSENKLFLRAVDKVGAASAWAETPEVFIRKPISDILFINAQQSSFNRSTVQQFYSNQIYTALNKNFDTLQAGPEGSAITDLSVDPQTQDRVFSYFKKIFVYSENSEYILSLLQRSSTGFFSKGGKLFLITEGNDVIEDQPSYLDFSPIARYTARPAGVSLLYNQFDSLYSSIPGYPTILNDAGILTGIRPFELPASGSNFTYSALYSGRITEDNNGGIAIWTGNSTLVAKRVRVATNQTDFIIALLPIYKFQNGPAMQAWFQKMLVDELQF
ncbi:MAG: hypothetical protein EP332_05485 [Bacteroidetes bacterium]|nr:MAG: hypothetical protein EP332_05485 [Bacteroidota bacterium]